MAFPRPRPTTGFTVAQAAQTDRYAKDLIEQDRCLSLAGVQDTGQNPDNRHGTGAEVLAFDQIGQRSIDIISEVKIRKNLGIMPELNINYFP